MKFLNLLFLFLFLTAVNLSGQSQLLNMNFNAGLPVNWLQNPAATWSLNTTLGTSGSGCAISEQINSNSVTVNLFTPTLNLSSVTNLTITFKAAVIKNNFVAPNVVLSYDVGAGAQFIARWGSGFSTNTTYTINDAFNPGSTINPTLVVWETCTHTVSAIKGSAVRFVFDGEFVNGGYVLIDDIVISDKPINTIGIKENEPNNSLVVFPNPTVNKHITLEGKIIKNILISDNLGKSVSVEYLTAGSSIELDLSKFANGIYYLTALIEDNILIYKKIAVE